MKNVFSFTIVLLLLSTQSMSFAKEIKLSSGDKQVNVVELFTSEGCSSCPPAENWLNKLQNDSRLWSEIVPVAFHVDYWDYLSWKDKFATAKNSNRQRRYKSESAVRGVYTPGFVVNGHEWRRWYSSPDIPISKEKPGRLDVSIDGDQIKANYTAATSAPKKLKLNVALLGFDVVSEIKRGENSGRKSTHSFVVIGQKTQNSSDGMWETTLPDTIHNTVEKRGIAVWVSQVDRQEPIQAVGGWLNE